MGNAEGVWDAAPRCAQNLWFCATGIQFAELNGWFLCVTVQNSCSWFQLFSGKVRKNSVYLKGDVIWICQCCCLWKTTCFHVILNIKIPGFCLLTSQLWNFRVILINTVVLKWLQHLLTIIEIKWNSWDSTFFVELPSALLDFSIPDAFLLATNPVKQYYILMNIYVLVFCISCTFQVWWWWTGFFFLWVFTNCILE